MNPRFALPTPADLELWLIAATGATATRKELVDPVRAGRAAYERRNRRRGNNMLAEITPDPTLTTYLRLSSYLRALAVRALGDLARQGHLPPTDDQLAEELADFAWTHHRGLIHIQEPGESKKTGLEGWTFVSADDVDHAARQAAERALASLSWRPGELRARQSAGGLRGRSSGTTKGPKPTKTTPANVSRAKALRELGMSLREIAAELGVSVGTAHKLLSFKK